MPQFKWLFVVRKIIQNIRTMKIGTNKGKEARLDVDMNEFLNKKYFHMGLLYRL